MTTFFLIDTHYTIEAGKAIIHLYGRDEKGKPITLKDENFQPYFYVLTKDPKALEKLKEEDYHVVKVEKEKKLLLEKPVTAYKVTVNLPTAVPVLRELAKEVGDTLEDDVLFTRRYLIDKGLTPLELVQAEVENDTIKSIKPAQGEYKPKALAFDIETYTPPGRMEIDYDNPIIMIALYAPDYKKVVTWKKAKGAEVLDSEKSMLERFVTLIKEYDPDILTGYNSDGFDLPYLLARCKKLKVELAIGKDNSSPIAKGRTRQEARIIGIAHVDLYKFIRRVLGRTMKTQSFSLDAVSKELLGKGKKDVDIASIGTAWNAGKIDKFVEYNLHDTKLTYDLMHKVWPSLLEMTKIVGLPLFDASRLSFSQFVEWYLMKKAFSMNELFPAKPGYKEQTRRMGQRAQGGYVFEPEPGVYDNIAVYDYRSLYPSIIVSHNISPGTVNCACCKGKIPEHDMHFCKKKQGFISGTIKELLDYRTNIKKESQKKKDVVLEARSYALKVLLNSFYGYLGFAMARWYSAQCVEAITAYARHYVKDVIAKAEQQGFTVRYGDTDSCMIELGKKTTKDAKKFLDLVNKDLPDPMELELEDVFPAGIWVATKSSTTGAKKRYALLDKEGNLTIKGFESVRRNAAVIARKVQQELLMIVLKDRNEKKAVKLVKDTVEKLRKNKLPVEEVVIKTQIQKNLDKYESIGPHVAAGKLMEKKGMTVKKGTLVAYIVKKGEGKIRDRVELAEDAKQSQYDGEYYISHSVIPAVENILHVLGVSPESITEATQQTSLKGF
ncbi:MAG: DNA-directed DNA polymerase [Candidatus Woesearchaeota archaeon]|jgi:DNA polymerase elongation subunit (family B)|nr:DNA-directed DNA polymerase [Candidatus Woesearchaeota archaeon]MDP7181578.1 DNA-directed DNA polymerase [Candidatus Woesearchaeota archaeon]MDP7198620.1 DNA-directed DNA polymerase [Candidatus Woesearchaeota archaeon]MDP7466638.1 DNA-directed DNA polymerase [Candidatus Woesearchaeota archaeon]MDP7646894.1 DNA-directed DNA polymerase [Candidatus Woesearchaeota archaeon]